MTDFPELEKRYGETADIFMKLEMDMIRNIEKNIMSRKRKDWRAEHE